MRYEDILMPGVPHPHDERHPSPERTPATLRPTPLDASVPPPKMRRPEADEMDGSDSNPDMDSVMEHWILAAVLAGVDITEVFSPERVWRRSTNSLQAAAWT